MTTATMSPRFDAIERRLLLREPDWSRLEAYYRLRATFLGEAMPDDIEAVAERPRPEMVTT